MAAAAVATILAAPSVVGEVAGISAFLAAGAAHIAAAMASLVERLEEAGRVEDGAGLRQENDELRSPSWTSSGS